MPFRQAKRRSVNGLKVAALHLSTKSWKTSWRSVPPSWPGQSVWREVRACEAWLASAPARPRFSAPARTFLQRQTGHSRWECWPPKAMTGLSFKFSCLELILKFKHQHSSRRYPNIFLNTKRDFKSTVVMSLLAKPFLATD